MASSNKSPARPAKSAHAIVTPLRVGNAVFIRTVTMHHTGRIAALDGDMEVTVAHLKRIAAPALRHRLRRDPLDDQFAQGGAVGARGQHVGKSRLARDGRGRAVVAIVDAVQVGAADRQRPGQRDRQQAGQAHGAGVKST